jgi:hypothetical protein
MDTTAVIVGFIGIALGAGLTALLTRRNERRSHADELLAQAVNGRALLSGFQPRCRGQRATFEPIDHGEPSLRREAV